MLTSVSKAFCSEYQPAIRNIGYTWFKQDKGWLEERETKDIEFHRRADFNRNCLMRREREGDWR